MKGLARTRLAKSAFAATIRACGGDAEPHVRQGGHHGYEQLAPASALAVTAVAAVTARGKWLARVLGAARR